MDIFKRTENLAGNLLQSPKREVRVITTLTIKLGEFIKIVSQKLGNYDQVFLVIKVVV